MPSPSSFVLRLGVRLILGLLLLVSLCIGVGGLSPHAHAASNTNLTVTDCTGESGSGQIGTVLASASAGDTITFSCSGTIPITSTLVIKTTNLTLDGSGQSVILDGRGGTPVLKVKSGVTFTLNALTIDHGYGGSPLGEDAGGLTNVGTTNITNSVFLYNSSPSFLGGAIFNSYAATLSISNSIIANNSASGGGGFYNYGTLTISNSTIANNTSGAGGGMETYALVSISNSTIANNTSYGDGGGILTGGYYSLSISNSTIANNTADAIGGGIRNDGSTVNVVGSIVANNSGGDCGQNGVLNDQGYNLSSDSSCGFTGIGSLQNTNPQLDPYGLQRNGSSIPTFALEPDSPAVDHIPTGSSCPSSDERGVSRPQGLACDIGAFEMTTADGLTVMMHEVTSFHLNQINQTLLNTQLQEALTAVNAGQTRQAFADMVVFTSEVKELTGHGLTTSQATQLLNEATVIKARLNS